MPKTKLKYSKLRWLKLGTKQKIQILINNSVKPKRRLKQNCKIKSRGSLKNAKYKNQIKTTTKATFQMLGLIKMSKKILS